MAKVETHEQKALFQAFLRRDLDRVGELLAKGVRAYFDECCPTPWCYVFSLSALEMTSRYVRPDEVLGGRGETLMHLAALAHSFMESKMDKYPGKYSEATWAGYSEEVELRRRGFQLLLDRGGDIDVPTAGRWPNTPLGLACEEEWHPTAVKQALMELGAKPDACPPLCDVPPINRTVHMIGGCDILRILRVMAPYVRNPDCADTSGSTP